MNAVALHESPLVRQNPVAPSKLKVRVQSVSYLAEDINAFEFVSTDSDALPCVYAGFAYRRAFTRRFDSAVFAV